jgi:hypothetical protein
MTIKTIFSGGYMDELKIFSDFIFPTAISVYLLIEVNKNLKEMNKLLIKIITKLE